MSEFLYILSCLLMLASKIDLSRCQDVCVSYGSTEVCGSTSTWADGLPDVTTTHNYHTNNPLIAAISFEYYLQVTNGPPILLCTYSFVSDQIPNCFSYGEPNCIDCSNNLASSNSVKSIFKIPDIDESKNDSGIAYADLGVQDQTLIHTLVVQGCQSPVTVATTNQSSNFTITTGTEGHFEDKGNCSCLGTNEKLFDTNGKEFKGEATCFQDAQWGGYGELQCWSGPTNASVLQSNTSVGERANFVCDFTDGFPSVTDAPVFKKNNIEIPSNYILKSSDNGKGVSCAVKSNYTDTVSPVIPITVYYDPENPQLSDDSPVIEVNGSADLNFTFLANPRDQNISLSFYSITGNDVPSSVLSWTSNYSRGTSQIHGFIVTVTSTDDYGEYDVCAATFKPVGKACSRLEISNATSTTNTPDTTEILNQSTIGSENPELQPNRIGIIVGAVVGGLVALLVIIAVIYFSRRKRDDVKEERINEIYDTSPNPGPSIEAVYAASGETSQREMTTNVAYEASPHQPEVQDVYTTVKRDKKGNGHTEKPSEDKSSPASTSVEQTAPVVNDVYAVVKK